jgi:2-polyprenyl-6-methoxyphenol hydroxylase-like FAD-dependent oxidoreductase
MRRHAEIAGGGIGGLGLGMMLAQMGWSVRIHERSPYIREIGAGISLRNNCITVLERYEALSRIQPHGAMIKREEHFDGQGRLLQTRDLGGQRNLILPRQNLVDGLAAAAREAGAEVVTSSHIVEADPVGALVDENGHRFEGDLVVGADGIHSRVRGALQASAKVRNLDTRINRFQVHAPAFTVDETKREYWSGDRRVGVIPSGPSGSLVYNVMPDSNVAACRLPLDIDDWAQAYPCLADLFPLLKSCETTQFPYPLVHCSRWCRGRVALIGDAAHGMPPALGQGAGLTMLNSHALAVLVTKMASVPDALVRWERSVRKISDATQRWSVRYDQITRTRSWPRGLRALRPSVIWAFGRYDFLNRRMRIADLGLPLIDRKIA